MLSQHLTRSANQLFIKGIIQPTTTQSIIHPSSFFLSNNKNKLFNNSIYFKKKNCCQQQQTLQQQAFFHTSILVKEKNNDNTTTKTNNNNNIDNTNNKSKEDNNQWFAFEGLPIALNKHSISHKWNVVEFDIEGNIKMNQIKRSELYSKYGLQGRDIRILVNTTNYPSILARHQCILVNIGNISAIITHEKLLLIKSDYINNLDPTFIKFIQQFLLYFSKSKELNKYSFDYTPYGFFEQSYTLPFEFRILECILHKVCANIESEKDLLQERCNEILSAPDYTNEDSLYQILQAKQHITRFKTFVTELHETINNILEQDDDMASMYLTDKVKGYPRTEDQHEEIEMLLETYQHRVENVMNVLDDLREDLDDTQEFLEVCLDSIRNKMMQMELKLAMAAFALTCGTLIAGIFGMNLLSHMEDHPYAFYTTTGIIMLLTFAVFMIVLVVCKRKGLFTPSYVTEKRKRLQSAITSRFGTGSGDGF
ncbi:hypothetical protein ABK040_007772 [Willaertia magna]